MATESISGRSRSLGIAAVVLGAWFGVLLVGASGDGAEPDGSDAGHHRLDKQLTAREQHRFGCRRLHPLRRRVGAGSLGGGSGVGDHSLDVVPLIISSRPAVSPVLAFRRRQRRRAR